MPVFSPQDLLPVFRAFPDARRGWIAYSGGLDSTVLLQAVAALRPRLRLEIVAVHFDHGLQAESAAWAEHCRACCARLGLPLVVRSLALSPVSGASLEALAREARQAAWQALIDTGDLLLTAHHGDDQAETVLLALLRGSGPKGLAAMPECAPFGRGAWRLRPLLAYGRRDLAAYARTQDLEWVEDPSNHSLTFDRNFLRQRVLPLLKERWPGCAASLAQSARHCAEAQEWIDQLAARGQREARGARPKTLSITALAAWPVSRIRAILRHWIAHLGLPPPPRRRLDNLCAQIRTAAPVRSPRVAWQGAEVRRYRDELFAMPPLPPPPADAPRPWREGSWTLPPGLGQLRLCDPAGVFLDPLTRWPAGLDIRFGTSGVRCQPGPEARHRRLKHLFQEAGIPPWLRPYVPLLFAAGQLVAIGDFWRCASAPPAAGPPFRVSWEGGVRAHPGYPSATDVFAALQKNT